MHKAIQPMSLVTDFKLKREHAHHLPRLLWLKGKRGPAAKVSVYLQLRKLGFKRGLYLVGVVAFKRYSRGNTALKIA